MMSPSRFRLIHARACAVAAAGLAIVAGLAWAAQYVEFTLSSPQGELSNISVTGIEGQVNAYQAITSDGQAYPIGDEGIEIQGVVYKIPQVESPQAGVRTLRLTRLADAANPSLDVEDIRYVVGAGANWSQDQVDLCAAGAPEPLAPAGCADPGRPWVWHTYPKELKVGDATLGFMFYVGYWNGPADQYQESYVVVRSTDSSAHLDSHQVSVVDAEFHLEGDLFVGLRKWDPRQMGVNRVSTQIVRPGALSPQSIPAQANTAAFSRDDQGNYQEIGSSREYVDWVNRDSQQTDKETSQGYTTSDLAGTWGGTSDGYQVALSFSDTGLVTGFGLSSCNVFGIAGSCVVEADGKVRGNVYGYGGCQGMNNYTHGGWNYSGGFSSPTTLNLSYSPTGGAEGSGSVVLTKR